MPASGPGIKTEVLKFLCAIC